MKSRSEIEELKKEIVIDAINYALNTRFIESINDFDHTNKKHIISALKHYRYNIKVEEEEKIFLNQMIVSDKNVPDIRYEKLIPKLIETQQTKKVSETIKEKTKEITKEVQKEIVKECPKEFKKLSQKNNEELISIKNEIKKNNEIKNKDDKITESLHSLIDDKIEKNLDLLSLEELIKEAYNRLKITKMYMKKVEKSLIDNG